jgi:hypothetical protein
MVRRTLALSTFLLLAGGSNVLAVDHPITGKKLLLRSTPKFVLLSKDADIGSPGTICNGVPPEVPFVTLTFDDGVNTHVFDLPCGNWKSNGAGTSWTFKNKEAPAGPSEVKILKLKDGLIKIVGKGLGSIPVPISNATIDVVLSVHGIADRYCMSFSGTGDGSKFHVKDAPASPCAPPTCQATTGGFCWFLADYGQSCTVLCASAGLVYDTATASFAGDGGTNANCLSVVTDLGVSAGTVSAESCFSGAGCVVRPAPAAPVRCSAPATTASGAEPGFRACACQ